MKRALPIMAVLALATPLLAGCVAAAIVPIAASGAIVGKTAAGTPGTGASGKRQAKPPVVAVGTGVAPPPPMVAPPMAEAAMAEPAVEAQEIQPDPAPPALSASAVLPAATAEGADDGYAAMAAYVLSASTTRPAKRTSALIDQRSLVSLPRMQDCGAQRGALLMDLDPGEKPFDLDNPPSPAPGLAERLRAIRGTGTAVVWIATLPQSESKRLANVLKATGLDPLGIDPVLLLKPRETRKQEILDRADEDWCVLAIAGDRKSDFDEVFDYLRNPDGPVALALEQHIGAGWFLVPPPIR